MKVINSRNLWSRVLVVLGGLVMFVGAADPMEGSLVILPGAGVVTLGTFLGDCPHSLRTYWLIILGLIALGVGALFAPSVHSQWGLVLVLPYPIGWVLGIVSLCFRAVMHVRQRHAALAHSVA